MELLIKFMYMIGFGVFAVLQSIIINGVHECFMGGCVKDMNKGEVCQGMILYPVARWIKKHVASEYILKPLMDCVKCMASVWGAVTYWPPVIMLFGFHWVEVPVFFYDMFLLVYLNYYFYKKL